MYLGKLLLNFCTQTNLVVTDVHHRFLYKGTVAELPENYKFYCVLPEIIVREANQLEIKICSNEEYFTEKYKGCFIPVYDAKHDMWVVETWECVEYGCLPYILKRFCGFCLTYGYEKPGKKEGVFTWTQSFEKLLEIVIQCKGDISFKYYKDTYSYAEQELYLIDCIKNAIKIVIEECRPLILEELLEASRSAYSE